MSVPPLLMFCLDRQRLERRPVEFFEWFSEYDSTWPCGSPSLRKIRICVTYTFAQGTAIPSVRHLLAARVC